MHHLSNLDASFLHFETPETPMHVGSLFLLDLPKDYKGDYYEEVKAMVGQRMHLSSVLTRKLAQMPFDLAEPVWIDDDDIDLDYHVRYMALRRPGSMKQLHALVARLHSMLLDRSRPLWEMYVIEGLANGQVGFYTKAHHSGIDGKAGTEMAKVMYDISPKVRKVPAAKRRYARTGGYQLGVAELLQAAVRNTAEQYRKLSDLLPSAASALTAASRVIASQQTAPGERPLVLGLAPKSMLNDSITNQRSFSAMSLSMDEVKAVGRRAGGTINTVVMAMCSEAVQRFLSARSAMPQEPLVAAVPVSLRSAGNDDMNNQVTMVRVDLATDIEDPVKRFQAIHNSSEAAKAIVRELSPVLNINMPFTGSPWIMSSLATLYGRSNLARELPPMANVLISNVPGPQATLYVAGAKMTNFYPVSIPYHGNAVNITVQSYDGLLEFGITACQRVLSQSESYELIGYLKDALEGIRELPAAAQPEAAKSAADKKKESAAKAPAAKKTASKKASTAKKTAAKKTTAAKAPAAKKPAAKKAASKKASTAKKAAAKKTTAAKAPAAKKAAAKKSAARKTATKKTAAKKLAANKPVSQAPAAASATPVATPVAPAATDADGGETGQQPS